MGVIDGMNKQITPTPSTEEDSGYRMNPLLLREGELNGH